MYCADCGRYFDEAIIIEEPEVGYREAHCPFCNSDDLEESHPCRCCGEETVDEFCVQCMETIAEELLDLQRRLGVSGERLEELIIAHYEL